MIVLAQRFRFSADIVCPMQARNTVRNIFRRRPVTAADCCHRWRRVTQKWCVSVLWTKTSMYVFFGIFVMTVYDQSLRLSQQLTQLGRSAIRSNAPCEGGAPGMGVPRIQV